MKKVSYNEWLAYCADRSHFTKLINLLGYYMTQNPVVRIEGGASYSFWKGKTPYLVIGPEMVFDQPKIIENLDELILRLEGAGYHEAAHPLYTDFSVLVEIEKQKTEVLTQLRGEADVYVKASSDADKKVSADKLQGLVERYIFASWMKSMLNSLEDAAIEHDMPVRYPKTYGAIAAMRDFIVRLERDQMRWKKIYATEQPTIADYMTDMRHLATWSYRNPGVEPVFLSDIVSEQELNEIKIMTHYVRVASGNTWNRLKCSSALMRYLMPVIKKDAAQWLESYLESLNKFNDVSASDLTEKLKSIDQAVPAIQSSGPVNPEFGPDNMQASANDGGGDDLLPDSLKEKLQQAADNLFNPNESDNSDGASSSENSNQSAGQNSDQVQQSEDASASDTESADTSDQGGNTGQADQGASDSQSQLSGEASDGSCSGSESASSPEPSSAESSASASASGADNKDEQAEELEKQAKQLAEQAQKEYEQAQQTIQESLKQIAKQLDISSVSDDEAKKSSRKGQPQSQKRGSVPDVTNTMGELQSFSSLHGGVPVHYHRTRLDAPLSDAGAVVQVDLTAIVREGRRVGKRLLDILKFQSDTQILDGRTDGMLNRNALVRACTDGRVFERYLDGQEHKARIQILIDLSGSMYGSKIKDAIAAACMVCEAAVEADLPVSVMGHSTYGRSVHIEHFVDFEHCTSKKYRQNILKADSGGANRDGLAIFLAGKDLQNHRQPDEKLLLFVISDGEPAHSFREYGGFSAEQDIRRIVETMNRQWNVETIGIGIGDDTEHVARIYGDHSLVVANTKELGVKMLKLLKKSVLR